MGKLIHLKDTCERKSYLQHFGFSHDPFGANGPDDDFWCGRSASSVILQLTRALSMPGLTIISGPAIAGGSPLRETIARQIEADGPYAEFTVAPASPEEFLGEVLVAFGFENVESDLPQCRNVLEAYLTHSARRQVWPLILIEQAESLSDEIMEEIARLAKIQIDDQPCVRIVFVARPEFVQRAESLYAESDLELIGLDGFDRENVADYVFERVNAAGLPGRSLFTPAAIKHLAVASGGVPGVINALCDLALTAAMESGSKKVSKRLIQAVTGEFTLTLDEESCVSGQQVPVSGEKAPAASVSSHHCLDLKRGNKHIARFDLKGGRLTIGRHKSNDIYIPSPGVSLFHAVIVAEEDSVYLFDLRSTNGTSVNGRDLRKKRLAEGDIIAFGAIQLTFHLGTESIDDQVLPSGVPHFAETVVLEESEASDPTIYLRSSF